MTRVDLYSEDVREWWSSKPLSAEWITYLVAWRESHGHIVKVGVTSRPSRWRSFVAHGASVVLLARAQPLVALELESRTHRVLELLATPAFASRLEARSHLGSGGGGWTECYRVHPDAAEAVMRGAAVALVQD